MNRHGLISGAPRAGKTKTLQMIAEQLPEAGVPTLLMDIKGDLSGLGYAGYASAGHHRTPGKDRVRLVAERLSVGILNLSNEPGAHLRATVSSLAPLLFSRMLGLNETQ